MLSDEKRRSSRQCGQCGCTVPVRETDPPPSGFVVFVPQDVPALLDELERLEARLREAHRELGRLLISDEPLSDKQMRRAISRSRDEGWRGITP